MLGVRLDIALEMRAFPCDEKEIAERDGTGKERRRCGPGSAIMNLLLCGLWRLPFCHDWSSGDGAGHRSLENFASL